MKCTLIFLDFLVEDDFLRKNTILLRCEGLDTVADVFVNNILIGKSENMFQRYDWDVKKFLVPGSNEIIISFTSAITYAAQKSKLYTHTIPPNCPPPVQHGECHVNLIRKKQCSFSWVHILFSFLFVHFLMNLFYIKDFWLMYKMSK